MTTRIALLFAAGLVALIGTGLLAAPAQAAGGPTSTSISLSANPASAGQPVTINVTVTGVFLSPLGLVQLFDGTSALGPPQFLIPDFDDADPICSGCVPTDHSSVSLTRRFSTGTHMLTAVYFGDASDFGSGGGPTTLTVHPASSGTAVASSADPSVHGQTVTFTASVSSTGDAPSGTVQFRIDGVDYGVAVALDAGGHASIAASDLAVGSHDVSASFTSDNPDVESSTGPLLVGILPLPQTVTAAETATTLTSSANPSEYAAAVTLTATTAAVPPGGGRPTGSVQFQDGGVDLGPPVTVDPAGEAVMTTASLAVGSHSITAAYSSDSPNFQASSATLDQTVGPARTTLDYDGAATADYHDAATLSARLTRTDDGSGVAGKTITFTMGSESCSATTGATGAAACSIVPQEAAGTYSLSAAFSGDAEYQSSSDGVAFVVTKEETSTVYTGPSAILQDHPVTLSARLLEDGTVPIEGRTMTLTLGTGTSAVRCTTGLTDSAGNAQCSVAATVAQGPQAILASFSGDAYYLSSTDARTAVVFAFPSRGAFVLGDGTAAAAGSSRVTFWSSTWSGANLLTGGTAPASFKGFASAIGATPPACDRTWSTKTGDSSSPVGVLPAYMGTIVSTSIGKAGSVVSGGIVHIVVVQTAPGYANDPGHAGTGTIVATYC